MLSDTSTMLFISTKQVALYSFVLSYYALLFSFFVIIAFFNIRNLRYVAELTFFNSSAVTSFYLVLIFLSFSGLPPFFLFFAKMGLLSIIVMNAPFLLILSILLLLFIGWYTYLNAAKIVCVAVYSFSAVASYNTCHISTVGALLLCFSTWFLLFGGFFFYDIIVYASWLSL